MDAVGLTKPIALFYADFATRLPHHGSAAAAQDQSGQGPATINLDGVLAVKGLTYGSVSTTAFTDSRSTAVDGQTAWSVEPKGELLTIDPFPAADVAG